MWKIPGVAKIPHKEIKILKFTQHHKTIQALAIIYADLICPLREEECKKNLIKTSTSKTSAHILYGYLISMIICLDKN